MFGKGKECFKVMVSVGPSRPDMEREVDLGIGSFGQEFGHLARAGGPLAILSSIRFLSSGPSDWISAARQA